jgi:hypothetical protein
MSAKLERIQKLLARRKDVEEITIPNMQGPQEITNSLTGRKALFSENVLAAAVKAQLHEIDVELARYGVEP